MFKDFINLLKEKYIYSSNDKKTDTKSNLKKTEKRSKSNDIKINPMTKFSKNIFNNENLNISLTPVSNLKNNLKKLSKFGLESQKELEKIESINNSNTHNNLKIEFLRQKRIKYLINLAKVENNINNNINKNFSCDFLTRHNSENSYRNRLNNGISNVKNSFYKKNYNYGLEENSICTTSLCKCDKKTINSSFMGSSM